MRAWATATGSSMNRLGSFIAPSIVGWLLAEYGGIAIVFAMFTLVSFFGAIVMWTMGEETKRARARGAFALIDRPGRRPPGGRGSCESVVSTYMGPPQLKPGFPDLEWTHVPAAHRFVTRHLQDCNWAQALEGGFDTSDLSFLHRDAASTADGRAIGLPTRYEVVPTDYGFVAGTGRETGAGALAWTANVMLLPFHKLIATTPIGAHVWVPMDDETTMNYCIEYSPDRPLED